MTDFRHIQQIQEDSLLCDCYAGCEKCKQNMNNQVKDMLPHAIKYLESANPSFGYAHIVLSDNNVSDEDIELCLTMAERKDYQDIIDESERIVTISILNAIKRLTYEERLEVVENLDVIAAAMRAVSDSKYKPSDILVQACDSQGNRFGVYVSELNEEQRNTLLEGKPLIID